MEYFGSPLRIPTGKTFFHSHSSKLQPFYCHRRICNFDWLKEMRWISHFFNCICQNYARKKPNIAQDKSESAEMWEILLTWAFWWKYKSGGGSYNFFIFYFLKYCFLQYCHILHLLKFSFCFCFFFFLFFCTNAIPSTLFCFFSPMPFALFMFIFSLNFCCTHPFFVSFFFFFPFCLCLCFCLLNMISSKFVFKLVNIDWLIDLISSHLHLFALSSTSHLPSSSPSPLPGWSKPLIDHLSTPSWTKRMWIGVYVFSIYFSMYWLICILMKPILYSRIGLLDKLWGVSSPILLAFADCNRAIIANKISKTKTKTWNHLWDSWQGISFL